MLYDYKVKRTLEQHHIEIADQFHRRQYAIKIRNFHFSVLSSKVFSPQELMSISNSFQWSELTPDNQFFMKDEMINLGIQCLYLLRISLGEIVIQRSMTKELTVSSVRSLTLTDLTPREGKLIEVVKEQQACDQLTITFGSDLEFMLYNKRTKRYINAHRLAQAQQGDTFGIDQAIAIHNLQVYHPIIEVRPKPAVSMEQLFMNLLSQYKQLTKYIGKHSDYVLITKPNINDRFNLGGHIHFGNIPFTLSLIHI